MTIAEQAPIYTLSAAILAATITGVISLKTSGNEFDSKMVEIGVNILAADPSKSDVAPARAWLTAEREALLHHRLAVDSKPSFYKGILPDYFDDLLTPCRFWEKQSDGSWKTKQGTKIVGEAMSVSTAAGSAAAVDLDARCGDSNDKPPH